MISVLEIIDGRNGDDRKERNEARECKDKGAILSDRKITFLS